MLTKDLLRHTNRRGRYYPRLIDTRDQSLRNIAEDLTHLYAHGAEQTADELSEMAQTLINGFTQPLIAKGFNHLLLKRCEFEAYSGNAADFRFQTFATSRRLIIQDDMSDLATFRAAVAQEMGMDSDEALTQRLYSDLPGRQPLTNFNAPSSEWLLNRYNLAQAQGGLYQATQVEIEIEESNAGKRRRLFQYLKFFQLLAQVKRLNGVKYQIFVDGPLSLFHQTVKYGGQLAAFLPALVRMKRWRLRATLKPNKNRASLNMELDQDSGLVSHYTRIAAYRPEAFERFERAFADLKSPWRLAPTLPVLDLGGQELVIPDFTFERPPQGEDNEVGGATKCSKSKVPSTDKRSKSKVPSTERRLRTSLVHLELFHRWHAGALERRLDRLDNDSTQSEPLALGVDRFLEKNDHMRKRLASSSWFKAHGFLFNQFPPPRRVLACLDGFTNENNE